MSSQRQETVHGEMEKTPVRYESQSKEYEIDLMELMYRLLERAKQIVVIAVLAALLTAVWTLFLVNPKYTATSKLYVLNPSDNVLNLSDLQIGSYLAADYKEVFSNWHVHEMVLQRTGLNYTYEQLGDMVSITNPSGTRILYISIISESADEAKLMADTYAAVAQEFISTTMDTEQPNLFEEALKPTTPSSPNKTRNIILGFLVGAIFAIIGFTIQFLLDDRIRTEEDVEKYFGMPSLGMMPKLSRDASSRNAHTGGTTTAKKAKRGAQHK